jgi:hypothetical protein
MLGPFNVSDNMYCCTMCKASSLRLWVPNGSDYDDYGAICRHRRFGGICCLLLQNRVFHSNLLPPRMASAASSGLLGVTCKKAVIVVRIFIGTTVTFVENLHAIPQC